MEKLVVKGKKMSEESLSLLGKRPIHLPKGVEIAIMDRKAEGLGKFFSAKGPKGIAYIPHIEGVFLDLDDKGLINVRVTEVLGSRRKAFHGLYCALAKNLVQGVSEGFKKGLEIQGVGMKFEIKGANLVLHAGYSNPRIIPIPQDIKLTVDKEKQTTLAIEGIDKQQVGLFAAIVRSQRPPEPYKGKGVRYAGEIVKRKEGKKAKK